MPVLVDRDTKVLCQGITGKFGGLHARGCQSYGTKLVGGVTPGRGGETAEGAPVFDTVSDAVRETGADATMIFVPPLGAADAILEAAAAGLRLVVAVTEGIPVLDMVRVKAALRGSPTRLVGPNCPGVITPGQCKIGIMPGYIHTPGPVGVVSRSGTLTYEAVWQLTQRKIGQSTCIGIGGDPVSGTSFVDALRLFQGDPATKAIVLIGEIGGRAEEDAAEVIRAEVRKPVVAFIAGAAAPPGRRMGHAGAVISGGSGAWKDKVDALRAVGAAISESPSRIGETMERVMRDRGLLGEK